MSTEIIATLLPYLWVPVIVPAIKFISRRLKANDKGVQALLRDRLIQSYNYYMDKGYAPIYARENWENMWKQYHNLGENGVMDDLHGKFMALPTERTERQEE